MMQKEKTKSRKHMDDLHFEHKVWMRQLEFSKQELEFYQKRVEEVAQDYTDKEVNIGIEGFQNRFIIQRNEIDEFMHVIRIHEDALEKEVKSNPVAVDHRLLNDHSDERNRFETFVKLYEELRKDFMAFLRKWM